MAHYWWLARVPESLGRRWARIPWIVSPVGSGGQTRDQFVTTWPITWLISLSICSLTWENIFSQQSRIYSWTGLPGTRDPGSLFESSVHQQVIPNPILSLTHAIKNSQIEIYNEQNKMWIFPNAQIFWINITVLWNFSRRMWHDWRMLPFLFWDGKSANMENMEFWATVDQIKCFGSRQLFHSAARL